MKWFTRVFTVLLTVTAAEPVLLACPVCFQADDSPTGRGIRAAVIVLCSVTTGVLGLCGVFVARFAARDREALRVANRPAVRDLEVRS